MRPAAPTLVLVHRAGAEVDAGVPRSFCCLRSTTDGTRAVVYRSARDQGVVGVVDFVSDAVPRTDRHGWAADGVFRPIEPYLPRAALLADPDLAAVFAHLQSRRRLPDAARRRLGELLTDLPPAPCTSEQLSPVRPR